MSLWVHLICPMSIFFLHGFYFFLWSSSSSIRGFFSSSGFIFPWFFFLWILQTVSSSVFFKFFRLWVLFSSNSSDLLLLLQIFFFFFFRFFYGTQVLETQISHGKNLHINNQNSSLWGSSFFTELKPHRLKMLICLIVSKLCLVTT